MKFNLSIDDVKAITTKLPQLTMQGDTRPQYQNLQFDLKSLDGGRVQVTVSAVYNYGGGVLSVFGSDYDGPSKVTLLVPPFKIPSGAIKACQTSGVNFAVSEDGKTITIGFGDRSITLSLYQPISSLRWSMFVPKTDPSLTIYFDREILERVLKAFDKGTDPCIRMDFYDPCSPVLLTQPAGTPIMAMALPVKAKDSEKYSDVSQHFLSMD